MNSNPINLTSKDSPVPKKMAMNSVVESVFGSEPNSDGKKTKTKTKSKSKSKNRVKKPKVLTKEGARLVAQEAQVRESGEKERAELRKAERARKEAHLQAQLQDLEAKEAIKNQLALLRAEREEEEVAGVSTPDKSLDEPSDTSHPSEKPAQKSLPMESSSDKSQESETGALLRKNPPRANKKPDFYQAASPGEKMIDDPSDDEVEGVRGEDYDSSSSEGSDSRESEESESSSEESEEEEEEDGEEKMETSSDNEKLPAEPAEAAEAPPKIDGEKGKECVEPSEAPTVILDQEEQAADGKKKKKAAKSDGKKRSSGKKRRGFEEGEGEWLSDGCSLVKKKRVEESQWLEEELEKDPTCIDDYKTIDEGEDGASSSSGEEKRVGRVMKVYGQGRDDDGFFVSRANKTVGNGLQVQTVKFTRLKSYSVRGTGEQKRFTHSVNMSMGPAMVEGWLRMMKHCPVDVRKRFNKTLLKPDIRNTIMEAQQGFGAE